MQGLDDFRGSRLPGRRSVGSVGDEVLDYFGGVGEDVALDVDEGGKGGSGVGEFDEVGSEVLAFEEDGLFDIEGLVDKGRGKEKRSQKRKG